MPLNFVAKAAITVALTAANMALTMTRKIEGPRLDDRKFSGGDYGSALAMMWGTRRIEVPVFWAEDLAEVKRQRKTKGGKFNEYTYYGTWAVALAGHEISAVTRVWFDTHLVLDLTGAGPITPFQLGYEGNGGKGGPLDFLGGVGGIVLGNQGAIEAEAFTVGDNFALYMGTETQLPDPRMQATVEAEFGEGSCPAYRGTAYIVFKNVPLEKLGNRIPQVSVEMTSGGTAAYPFESYDTLGLDANLSRLWGATFSPDYSRFMWASPTSYEIWDVAARARMIGGVLPVAIDFGSIALFSDGSFIATEGVPTTIYSFSADGLTSSIVYEAPSSGYWMMGARAVQDGNGNEHWCAFSWSTNTRFMFDGEVYRASDLTGASWTCTTCFVDAEGSVWVGGAESGFTTEAYFYRMVLGPEATGSDVIHVTGLPSSGASIQDLTACAAGENIFLQWGGGDGLFLVDRDGNILASDTTTSIGPYSIDTQIDAKPPSAETIWIDNREFSLADLSIVRTVTLNNWTTELASGVVYDPINHALITSPNNDAKITWRFLDRLSGDGVPLSTICGDVADMVGVEDYDFSDLDQTVPGWSATQGPGAQIVEPLLDAYDSDVRPHDFSLQGLKRHGVTGGTLLTERFVGDPRYTVKVRQAAELPRAVTINFADTAADQQPNNARADRPLDTTGARGEKSLDLTPLALDVDTARGLADRYFRRIWNERIEPVLALTAQQLALEPADVRTLNLDGETVIARLRSVTIGADDVLQTEWVYDSPSLALMDGASGATFDGRNPSEIIVPLLSKGFVLDVPLLEDSDNDANPLLYVAAAPYASGTWPGAIIYEAVDGEYSEETASVLSSSPATWGYANAALPDANPWVWDRGSSVNVTIQTGTLTGCTEAAIDANPRLNMAILGDEIINFTTATLESDGTYTLSGFKRGRRGTEWACGTHAGRDVFLLLDTADAVEQGLSEVGTSLSFKAVTNGRTESGAFPIPVSYTGASLKPYAPVHLEAVKESNGDWTLTWTRRTRVGGAWTSGTSIPLGETSEEYELDLSDGVDTVTKTVTSATYTWTQADQVTDVGAEVMEGDLDWSVFQISASVDRGFEASATA